MSINRIIEGGTDNLDFATMVKNEVSRRFLSNDLIAGIGISKGTSARYALVMYLYRNDERAAMFVNALPKYVEGIPLNVEYVGKTRTY